MKFTLNKEIEESILHINYFADKISIWRAQNGFQTPANLLSVESRDLMLGKLMLVVTEIAEAAEAVRHENLDNFKEELADTFIRLMDITASCEIDIEYEIKKKMETNLNRPYRHGKTCSL